MKAYFQNIEQDNFGDTRDWPFLAGCTAILLLLCVFFGSRLAYELPTLRDYPQLGFIETTGPVQYRRPGNFRWSVFEERRPIFYRDSIFTEVGSTAVVTLENGEKIEIGENTLVRFEMTADQNLKLSLLSGTIKNKLETASVEKKEDNRFLKALTQKNPYAPNVAPFETELAMLTRQLDIAKKKQPFIQDTSIRLKTVDKLDLEDFGFALAAPGVKKIKRKKNSYWVTLHWSKVKNPHVYYEVQMSQHKKFNKKVKFKTLKNYIQVRLEGSGRYEASVLAYTDLKITESNSIAFYLDPKEPTKFSLDLPKK